MPEAVPDLEGPAEQQQRLRPPGQGPRCRSAGRRGTGAGAETTQGAGAVHGTRNGSTGEGWAEEVLGGFKHWFSMG